MNNIELFYKLKDLFNTPEEIFEKFYLLKNITTFCEENKILYITINEISKNELIKKYETLVGCKRVNKDVLKFHNQEYREDIYIEITTIEKIKNSRTLDGLRYREIRFYQ